MSLHQDFQDLKPEVVAEDIAKEALLNLDNGNFIVHSAAVKFVSLALAERRDDIDKQVLVVGSWIHNIGKARDDADHARIGCEIAKTVFKNKDSDFYYKLSDCILNHGCACHPETKEGIIVHDADKIAFFHPTYLDFMKAEFEREKAPENFLKFIEQKMKLRDAIVLPESRELFDEYASQAKNML